MEVMTIRKKSERAIGGWSPTIGRAGLQWWRLGSPQALRPRREQFTPKLIEISQRKHGLCPCQVLGQATVSHFGEAPQVLDHAKGVFAARPVANAPG